MPPPLTTLRETVCKTLPQTVTVGADTISTGLVWLTEPPAKKVYPAWLVGYLGPSVDLTEVANVYEGYSTVTETIADESHTFATGDTYTVLDEMDVDTVTAVTGTVGGQPYTFVAGTDYQLADSDLDGADDAIEWLSGGTKPDNGTAVLVDYTHKLLDKHRSRLYEAALVVHAVASPLESGEQGAMTTRRPSEVVEAMQEALVTWFEKDLRPTLESAGFKLQDKLTQEAPFQVEKSAILQQTNTFGVLYQVDVTLDRVRTVRKLPTTSEVSTT